MVREAVNLVATSFELSLPVHRHIHAPQARLKVECEGLHFEFIRLCCANSLQSFGHLPANLLSAIYVVIVYHATLDIS